jgi:hypothetical protein
MYSLRTSHKYKYAHITHWREVCKIKYELEYEMPTSTKSKQQLANKIQELKYIDGLKSSYRKFKL